MNNILLALYGLNVSGDPGLVESQVDHVAPFLVCLMDLAGASDSTYLVQYTCDT